MCAIAMSEHKELTLPEVAKRLNVSYQTVLRRIKARKLRARKEGQEWRVSEDDLARYIEQTYLDGMDEDG
jgi:excisionase family DNA binding protein